MASYDIANDKIRGAKRGSLVWHHENRHREQWKSGLISKLRTWATFTLMLIVALLIPNKWYMHLLFIIYLMLHTGYIELEAWYYAFKRYNRE